MKKYLQLARQKGLCLEDLVLMEEYELQKLFAAPKGQNEKRAQDLTALFPGFEKELKRTGVTRWILWGEYKSHYPHGYSYLNRHTSTPLLMTRYTSLRLRSG